MINYKILMLFIIGFAQVSWAEDSLSKLNNYLPENERIESKNLSIQLIKKKLQDLKPEDKNADLIRSALMDLYDEHVRDVVREINFYRDVDQAQDVNPLDIQSIGTDLAETTFRMIWTVEEYKKTLKEKFKICSVKKDCQNVLSTLMYREGYDFDYNSLAPDFKEAEEPIVWGVTGGLFVGGLLAAVNVFDYLVGSGIAPGFGITALGVGGPAAAIPLYLTMKYTLNSAKYKLKENKKKANYNILMKAFVTRLQQLGLNCPSDPALFENWFQKVILENEVNDIERFSSVKGLNKELKRYKGQLELIKSQLDDKKDNDSVIVKQIISERLKELPKKGFKKLADQGDLYHSKDRLKLQYETHKQKFENVGITPYTILETLDDHSSEIFSSELTAMIMNDDHITASTVSDQRLLFYIKPDLLQLLPESEYPGGFNVTMSKEPLKETKSWLLSISITSKVDPKISTSIQVPFESGKRYQEVYQDPIKRLELVERIKYQLEHSDNFASFEKLLETAKAQGLIAATKVKPEVGETLETLKQRIGHLPSVGNSPFPENVESVKVYPSLLSFQVPSTSKLSVKSVASSVRYFRI